MSDPPGRPSVELLGSWTFEVLEGETKVCFEATRGVCPRISGLAVLPRGAQRLRRVGRRVYLQELRKQQAQGRRLSGHQVTAEVLLDTPHVQRRRPAEQVPAGRSQHRVIPRPSEEQAWRLTSPASSMRSMSLESPLLLCSTTSARSCILICPSGTLESLSRTSYQRSGRPCSASSRVPDGRGSPREHAPGPPRAPGVRGALDSSTNGTREISNCLSARKVVLARTLSAGASGSGVG